MIVQTKNTKFYKSAFDYAHRELTKEQLIEFYGRSIDDMDKEILISENKNEVADFIIEFLLSYGWSDYEFIEEALTRIDKKFIFKYSDSNEVFVISEVE